MTKLIRLPARASYAVWRTNRSWVAMEWCQLAEGGRGFKLSGCAVGATASNPLRIDYSIVCDFGWHPRKVDVRRRKGGDDTQLRLECENGKWKVGGTVARDLDGSSDIDFGFSPSTNTIPIRRLDLRVGESAEISAVWIRFPQFDIVQVKQSYSRTADRIYRYASASFEADVFVDEVGLVTDYAEWTRIN